MNKTYNVSFSVSVPETVSREDFEEWLRFELGANGGMSLDNPLDGTDLEVNSFSIIIS